MAGHTEVVHVDGRELGLRGCPRIQPRATPRDVLSPTTCGVNAPLPPVAPRNLLRPRMLVSMSFCEYEFMLVYPNRLELRNHPLLLKSCVCTYHP